ncbi:hypothetical protein QBZ16_003870 [Prototheca wickerhamii]|uniref:Uncharacterized protein n=1 Tax=Prototheca wickerhamii TaxID=3111 RepID=A0AAD9MI85_PROWI|nr:hypothetical protein QBZ16_003870 [Prototheca wickerhamii]
MAPVADDLMEALQCHPPTIPCRFLYDCLGSRLYSEITELPEYTPYRAELGLLESRGASIGKHLPGSSLLVELGCGDATKTCHLLNTLLDTREDLEYVGIDVSAEALRQTERTLRRACPRLPAASLHLVEAEYLVGLRRVRREHPGATLCVLWLGSSIGNFADGQAEVYLQGLAEAAGPEARLLLGADGWKAPALLRAAYHDSRGVTERFIVNGVRNMLRTLGHPDAEAEGLWAYQVEVSRELQRVEMWVAPRRAVRDIVPGVSLAPGERLLVEISRKFTQASLAKLAQGAGMAVLERWATPGYALSLLRPARAALTAAWADTDAVLGLVRDWTARPIGLRNPFSFYYGHNMSFARTRLLPGAAPSALDETYSRGIDPSVADPTRCHAHPAPPPEWPGREEVTAYVRGVRKELLEAGDLDAHALHMSIEHERMHQETLCYMLAKQRRADWVCAGGGDGAEAAKNRTALVTGGQARLGVPSAATKHGFVWDNEMGEPEPVKLPAFHASRRPVTIAQFKRFVEDAKPYDTPELWTAKDWAHLSKCPDWRHPASWVYPAPGQPLHVAFAEGVFPWTEVAERPAFVSLAEAEAYCRWAGGRIMSEPEHALCLAHNERCALSDASEGGGALLQLESAGWEWTCTPFAPFKGFSPDPLYPEYSTDFFDGEHYVLKGSSPYTHPSMRRTSFRNFYQRLYPYVPAKFRLVFDAREE